MTDDPRLDWCRENIPHFKDYNDQVLKAHEDERANRERFACCRLVTPKPACTAYEGEAE